MNESSRAPSPGRYLLVSELRFVAGLWIVFAIGIAVVVAAVANWGTITSSVWEKATQLPRWFMAVWGIYQTAVYLPLFIAHGYTRREFVARMLPVTIVYTMAVALLITIGFALESLAYAAFGWPHVLDDAHLLFSESTQFPLILAQYALTFFAWVTIGAVIGAAFYRFRHWGVPVVPAALVALVLIESALGPAMIFRPGFPDLALAMPSALAIYALVVAGGLAVTWTLIHDVPLRTRSG